MSKAMIDIIEKTINEDYHLPRESRDWLLADGVKLRASDRNSLGFSLDNKEKPPFAFFKDAPPAYITKMCDAVIALSIEQKLYLFIVEQKTSNPGDYEKQLTNGKYFCDWLFSLYKEHGHCSDDPVYIGLLIWQPRTSPPKGETSHKRKLTSRTHHRFEHCFEEKNNQNIHLQKFVQGL